MADGRYSVAMEIVPLGDSALIVRVVDEFRPDESLDAVLAALRYLKAAAIPGVIELAPAYTTIGVFFDPAHIESADSDHSPFDVLSAQIQSNLSASSFKNETAIATPLIEIPVCYEREFAPDIDDVARVAGLAEAEVIHRHSSGVYRVNCVGFIAGFPFLSGLPSGTRDAAPGRSAQGGSCRLGRDRRRANRDLSEKFSRRLESDRAHSAALVRCPT